MGCCSYPLFILFKRSLNFCLPWSKAISSQRPVAMPLLFMSLLHTSKGVLAFLQGLLGCVHCPFFWHVQVQMSDFLRIVYIVGSRYRCSGKHEHVSDLVCPCNAQNGVVNSSCRKCSAHILAQRRLSRNHFLGETYWTCWWQPGQSFCKFLFSWTCLW